MAQVKDLIVSGASRFLNTINGNINGTATNVTGTVAISNGGTGATTRLGAAKALTDEPVVTPGFVVGLTDSWGKFGYTSIANLKTTLGAMTPASHTHGNIQNGGTLQTSDITIASGDKLVVTDSSDSSKIARTSISFDGSTTTQCLTKKGTWATFGTSNLTIGTTASTAMAGNTNVNNVTQNVLSTTGTSSYKILLSGSADASAHTEGVYKYSTLEFTPDNDASVFDGNTLSMYNNSWETVIRLSCGTSPYVYVKDSSTTCLKAYNSNMIIGNNISNPTKYVQSGLDSTDSTPFIELRDKTSDAIYSWSRIKPEEIKVAKSQVGSMSIQPSDIVIGDTWDGTNTSLKTAVTNKLDKSGGDMTGQINFKCTNSSTEDTPDLVFLYYNGKEKARIWCDGTFSSFVGAYYRCKNNPSSGDQTTWSGRLAVTSSSDIRLKENVKDTEVDKALDVINQIKIRSFDWKNMDKHQKIGFVADELEEIDANFVDEGSGGYNKFGDINPKSVNNFYMLGYIVKAIQELSAEVDKLKAQLNK